MDKKLEILACIFPCLYKTYSTSAVLNYNAIFKACNAKIWWLLFLIPKHNTKNVVEEWGTAR